MARYMGIRYTLSRDGFGFGAVRMVTVYFGGQRYCFDSVYTAELFMANIS